MSQNVTPKKDVGWRPAPRGRPVRPRTALAAIVAAVILTATAPAQSDPPAKARTDAEGVPLPDGAVARLGSSRFRHDGSPWGLVTFSPDSRRIAVRSPNSVCVLDAATGRQLYRFDRPESCHPKTVRFLADAKRLVVGFTGKGSARVTVYELAGGKAVGTWTVADQDHVSIADVTPDGTHALARDGAAKVYLWDLKAGRAAWEFQGAEGMHLLPLTADGKRFVTAGPQTAELRDVQTGDIISTFPDPGPAFDGRQRPGMAGDGRIAVSDNKRDAVNVLTPGRKDGTLALKVGRQGEFIPFFSTAQDTPYLFSPEGRFLVGLSWTGTLVWDLSAPADRGPVGRLPPASGAAFSPDGKTLVLDDDGTLVARAVGTWKRLPQSADPPSPVHRVWFTDDGQRVIGYTRHGWVAWPAAGARTAHLSDETPVSISLIQFEGQADVSADGKTGVDVIEEPDPKGGQRRVALRLTDLIAGTARRFPLGERLSSPVQISADGRLVWAEDMQSDFCTWDAASGRELGRTDIPYPTEQLIAAVPTADGKSLSRLVVGVPVGARAGPPGSPYYRSVTVTDHSSGQKWQMDSLPGRVAEGDAWFSRDGSRLVLVGQLGKDSDTEAVSVWDVASGRRLTAWVSGFTGRPASAALSADNRSLLSGSIKGKLSLVEVATGGERANFHHRGRILAAAFAPNGARAVASSPDAPVYIWDLIGDPGRWGTNKADVLWADLTSADAKTAYAAIRRLRANPAQAVAFLRDRVQVPVVPTDEAVDGLLRRLDSPAFADRERAQKELTAAADLVRPRLEAARKAATEETGRRLDQVLKTIDDWTPDRLRHVRACEVMEGIGSPDAKAVLRTWAAGPVGARLTTEATESLGRLKP